jgi:hypothetical protein
MWRDMGLVFYRGTTWRRSAGGRNSTIDRLNARAPANKLAEPKPGLAIFHQMSEPWLNGSKTTVSSAIFERPL